VSLSPLAHAQSSEKAPILQIIETDPTPLFSSQLNEYLPALFTPFWNGAVDMNDMKTFPV